MNTIYEYYELLALDPQRPKPIFNNIKSITDMFNNEKQLSYYFNKDTDTYRVNAKGGNENTKLKVNIIYYKLY
jgi:hypothetical protein